MRTPDPTPRPRAFGPRLAVLTAVGLALVGLLGLAVTQPRPAGAQADAEGAGGAEAAAVATAEDPIKAGLVEPDAVSALARELNCPLCQGYNLQDCPLTVCAQMRMLIAQQLAAGMTPEEIRAGFVADYGPQVMNVPPARGAWLLAWLAPGMALALAALWMGLRWRRRASTEMDPGPADRSASQAPDSNDGIRDALTEVGATDFAARFEALAREEEA